jgi:hypothetical protein
METEPVSEMSFFETLEDLKKKKRLSVNSIPVLLSFVYTWQYRIWFCLTWSGSERSCLALHT